MAGNQFGHFLKWTTFGESHGEAMGLVIEGCPAGLMLDLNELVLALKRRRPGQSSIVSDRKEDDHPQILSGIFEGKSLGTPIAITVKNINAQSKDYDQIKKSPRVGHADDLWQLKFGHSDHRGGGRSSGRETLGRVAAGWVAKSICLAIHPELKVVGWTHSIGDVSSGLEFDINFRISEIDSVIQKIENSKVRCPDSVASNEMIKLLESAKENGKSYGGAAQIKVFGVPAGLGQPVFSKLKSEFAFALFGVGAVSGFELGDGIGAAAAEGSEFHSINGAQYGGIRGGISTGEPIDMKAYFKPTSSVLDVAKKGRHDPCIVPRAVPVLEAMVWAVLADQILMSRLDKI